MAHPAGAPAWTDLVDRADRFRRDGGSVEVLEGEAARRDALDLLRGLPVRAATGAAHAVQAVHAFLSDPPRRSLVVARLGGDTAAVLSIVETERQSRAVALHVVDWLGSAAPGRGAASAAVVAAARRAAVVGAALAIEASADSVPFYLGCGMRLTAPAGPFGGDTAVFDAGDCRAIAAA